MLLCAGVNALGKCVWKARLGLSALMAASASLISSSYHNTGKKGMVQEIMKKHLVFREWKFSTDVGVFFCIH